MGFERNFEIDSHELVRADDESALKRFDITIDITANAYEHLTDYEVIEVHDENNEEFQLESLPMIDQISIHEKAQALADENYRDAVEAAIDAEADRRRDD